MRNFWQASDGLPVETEPLSLCYHWTGHPVDFGLESAYFELEWFSLALIIGLPNAAL